MSFGFSILNHLLLNVSVQRTGNNMIRLSPFISTSPTTHHPSPLSITLRPKTAARSCSLASPHHSQLTSDSRQLSWTGFCHKQTSLLWVEEVLIIILWLLWDSRRKILISKKTCHVITSKLQFNNVRWWHVFSSCWPLSWSHSWGQVGLEGSYCSLPSSRWVSLWGPLSPQ